MEDIDSLCEIYYRDVYQYCLYFTNNKSDAEDLTQETFMKVMKALPTFNHQSKVKTWIISIAKNTAIDHYRRKKIVKFIPDLFLSKEITKEGLPESELYMKEDWQEVVDALTSLKPAYRNVIILRGIQEVSIKETAEILNWKESKVRVDYHRAIQQLQSILSPTERGIYSDAKSK
ncbi:RNA polymerase sigma factor [Bacillus tamaricis]|uniref:RNA polymerase sigma factor n=1 Tax=Evansella tamaricis TaxID=2069301 RepID=A0ABS6JC13_9BACI|nr:RNA polymerase sigma factor [Evansella tamaricis]